MLWQQVNWYLGTQNDKPNNVWSDLKHLGICERGVLSSVVSVPELFFFVQMISHALAQVWVRTHSPHPCLMLHAHCRCVSIWSLRHLHLLLLPHRLLSDHPVFPSTRQRHLPRCGGQIPCVLPLRTLGWERASHKLWTQRVPHHEGLWTLHPEILGQAEVHQWLRLRWRHYRQGALLCLPKTSRSLWRRRPVVLSVVVCHSW